MFNWKPVSILLITILLIIQPAFSNKTLKNSQAKEYYQNGLQFFKDKNYPEALIFFREAKRIEPDYPILYKKIANTYSKLENYRLSLKYYNRFIYILLQNKNKALLPYAYKDIAGVYFRIQEYEKALEYYFKVLNLINKTKKNDLKAQIYLNIGSIKQELKQVDDAFIYYKKALKFNLRNKNSSSLAHSYLKMGYILNVKKQFSEASNYYSQALEIFITLKDAKMSGIAYLHIGQVHKNMHNFSQAFNFYNKSLKIFNVLNAYDEVTLTYNYVGELFLAQNRVARAKFSFEVGINTSKRTNVYRHVSKCYDNLISILLKQSEDSKAFIFLHKHYYLTLKIHHKSKQKQIVKQINAVKEKINYNLFDESEKINLCIILNNIGILYKTRLKYKKAIDSYQLSLDILEPMGKKEMMAKVYFNIGEVYFDKKDFERSFQFYKKAIKNAGNKKTLFLSHLYSALGHIYRKKGKLDLAFNHYKKSYGISKELKLNKQLPVDHINLGKVYYLKGELDNSLYHYITAYKLSKHYQTQLRAKLYNNLAEVYLTKNELENAEVFLNRALSLREDDNTSFSKGITYYHLGVLYQKREEYTKARQFYLQARAIFSDYSISSIAEVERKIVEINKISPPSKIDKNLDATEG